MREWLPEMLALPLYPLLRWQGQRTRQWVPRLSEPSDEAHGIVGEGGEGMPLSLMLIGESPVAGIGVDFHTEGIGAATATVLARASGRAVAWQSRGINGITAAQALHTLGPTIADSPIDIVVVAFGVNDSTGFRRYAQWQSDVQNLLDLLQKRVQPRLTLLSGVPPLGAFPALPSPLREVLGLKAASLDRGLVRLAARRPATIHVPLPQNLSDPGLMARDGYHPSAAGCRLWAATLAAAVPQSALARD
jgi:lysophospholipase L1-like esterase